MATTGRNLKHVVLLTFVAGGLIAWAARLDSSVGAAESTNGLGGQVAPKKSAQGGSTRAGVSPQPPVDGIQILAPDADNPMLAGRFIGRVNGPDGKPFSGARVYLVRDKSTINERGPVRAKTDPHGRFEFDAPDMTFTEIDSLPARRPGVLIATAAGLAPDWMETWGRTGSNVRSHWDLDKDAHLDLQLAKDDVVLHGRFLGPDGRPLAGARVRLIALHIPPRRDLDDFLERVKKSMWGCGSDERSLYRPQLLPGVTTETRTDADGQFKLTGLGRDRLAQLQVEAPSVVDTEIQVMTRDAPDVGQKFGGPVYGAGFTLKLARGRTIRGRVIDRDSREPIRGMWVGLEHRPNPQTDLTRDRFPWATDEQSRFEITGQPIIARKDVERDLTPVSARIKVLPGGFLTIPVYKEHVLAVAAPGLPYRTARVEIECDRDREVLIECRRGIPFHLKLVDERGRPVQAEVSYVPVQASPPALDMWKEIAHDPVSQAVRKAEGTYDGYVLPGPGAVLVKAPCGSGFRPAHVDPKAFFAPGRRNWSAQEEINAYGTQDTVSLYGSWIDQHDYAAIVLVNPAPDSGPLQLSATLVKDRRRRVTLVAPDGKPVLGAETIGMTYFPWDFEPPLRASSFFVTGLNPDRGRRITFFDKKRQLIGFLFARGDGDSPYVVHMQLWGTVIGQFVDEAGQPVKASLTDGFLVSQPDPAVGTFGNAESDAGGRFRIEKLVPGQRYSAEIYRDPNSMGLYGGMAFEKLVLRAGEFCDLGEIHLRPAVKRSGPTSAEVFTSDLEAGLKELGDLHKLTTLTLRRTRFTGAALKQLGELTNLTSLDLGGTKITDVGLKWLKGMKNLTELRLSDTRISNAGLNELRELRNLTTLDLTRSQITDAGLKPLGRLEQLTSLDLSGTRINDAGIKELRHLRKLTTLDLSLTQITDAGLKELRNLENLTTLTLKYTKISLAGLRELRQIRTLKALYLSVGPDRRDVVKKPSELNPLSESMPKVELYVAQ
jgi:hypothetical protein